MAVCESAHWWQPQPSDALTSQTLSSALMAANSAPCNTVSSPMVTAMLSGLSVTCTSLPYVPAGSIMNISTYDWGSERVSSWPMRVLAGGSRLVLPPLVPLQLQANALRYND